MQRTLFDILLSIIFMLGFPGSALAQKASELDGDYRCSVKSYDAKFGYQHRHSFELKVVQGVVKSFVANQEAKGAGDVQGCGIQLSALQQVSVPNGLLLSTGPGEGISGVCNVRINKSADVLKVQFGDHAKQGDDCRSSSAEMFCTPRAFWNDLELNLKNKKCSLAQ